MLPRLPLRTPLRPAPGVPSELSAPLGSPAAHLAAAACLLLTACGTGNAGRPAAEARPAGPNLLLVTIDTLRADHLGTYGYERGTSPNLDRFADSAVVFEDATVPASWTLPSLASLFTSLYSSTHGCWFFDSRLDDSFCTLAETLCDAGWDTALIASHVFLGAQYGLNQGFVHFDDEMVHEMYQSDRSITSPEVSARAVRFLEQQAASPDAGPWFLWAHYFDPHAVYQPQAGFSERFGTTEDVDLYDGEIAFTDHHLGSLLAALEQNGFADDTIVVLVSDHGEEFREHGSLLHGHSLYQELVHTPLLVRAPGFAPRRVTAPVRAIDVMPTLLELLALEPRRRLEGTSLVPALRGEAHAELPILSELRLDDDHCLDSLRRGTWKLVVDRTNDRRHLFDLAVDPAELTDVADLHPERVRELAAQLEELQLAAREEARFYSVGSRTELLPGQLQNISDLGYADTDAER